MPQRNITRLKREHCEPQTITLIVKDEAFCHYRPPSMIEYDGRVWAHWAAKQREDGDLDLILSHPVNLSDYYWIEK